jgi:dTDP-4-amino-4,6-dideoxygalactose transaminase
MQVPFLNLALHHAPLRKEFDRVVADVIESSAFAGGPFVEKFEDEFAAYCGCESTIGVGSGTDALWLCLLANKIGPGDEVVTVPNTFMATGEAITFTGARPVFIDVDERTYTMDPAALQAVITPRTKAVIPVHLFGQPADMEPILAVARKHGLIVIEDAAQAHGAKYKGRTAGTMGDAGCFSFYPGKNLGAFGEAGAVVTNDTALRDRIRTLRDHGQVRKYHHSVIGWNCRMDGIQAAVLRVKLGHLDKGNSLRREHARQYDAGFEGIDEVITPRQADYARHVYHVYAVRVSNRDKMMSILRERGVQTAIHYPVPIHLQPAYRNLGYKEGDFPVSEQVALEFISLPMFPELSVAQIDHVTSVVKEALGAAGTKTALSVSEPAVAVSSASA